MSMAIWIKMYEEGFFFMSSLLLDQMTQPD